MRPPTVKAAGVAAEVGDRLAERYVLTERIGAGGMGVVFRARDESLDEDIAIKLLLERHSSDGDYRSRLRQEVRLARRVSHPNVCRVHDIGIDDNRLFVTMEYVAGDSLRGYLRDVREGKSLRCSLARAVDILGQMLAGLGAAHRSGVIHRDVKPDNVIIDADRAVLTDFGVARHGATDGEGTTVIAGTPAYIAPELLRGEGYDHRADVYSAAVVAYELICGRHPFDISDLAAAAAHARAPLPPPPVPDHFDDLAVSAALSEVFAAALALAPSDRPATPEALAELLGRAIRAGDPATADAPIAKARLDHRHLDQTLIGSAAPLTPPDQTIAPPSTESGRKEAVRVAVVLAFSNAEVPPAGACDHLATGTLRPATLGAGAERLERAILDLDGTPVELGDDYALAVFGVPRSAGDDAARATQVAKLLVEHTAGGRAAITCGRVTVEGSSALRLGGDAIAEARAQLRAAREGQVSIDDVVARQVAGRYAVEEVPGDSGGRSQLIVVGTHAATNRDYRAALRQETQQRLIERARFCFENRQPTFAAVRAPAGFGKTRLRDAFIAELNERREVEWLLGHGAQLGTAAPLSLIRSADPRLFAAIASVGLSDPAATAAAALRMIESRALLRPVVFLLDDMQWADDVSLAVLENLRHQLRDVPVLIITFGREETPIGIGEQRIELSPLRSAEAVALIREFAPALDQASVDMIVERGGGNAFFIEELTRDFLEQPEGARALAVPASIEAIVQARLDRLEAHERAVLSAAAVLGQEAPRLALLAMTSTELEGRSSLDAPANVRELDRALGELVIRGLLEVELEQQLPDVYKIPQRMLRETAYTCLSEPHRRTLHRAAAAYFDSEVAAASAANPLQLATLAHHREQAGDRAGAHKAYREAGLLSLELHANADALAALTRAHELCDAADAELLERLGDAQRSAATTPEALASYDAALALCTGSALAAANLHDKRGAALTQLGDTRGAIAAHQAGLALVAPGGELTAESKAHPVTASRLFGNLGWLLGYQLGDNVSGLAHSERAVALLEDTPHRRDLARALSRLGANYMRAGRWREQLACNRRHLDIGVELRDVSMQLTAHVNLGVVYASLGELDNAIGHTRRALAFAKQTGALSTLGLCESNLGGLYLETQRLDDAEVAIENGIKIAERCATRQYLPEALGFRARLAIERGALDAAVTDLDQAVEVAESAGLEIDLGIALRLRGGLSRLRGNRDAAIVDFDRSLTLLGAADEFEHARTMAARAQLEASAGDLALAESLRARAREVFAKVGATRELQLLDTSMAVR